MAEKKATLDVRAFRLFSKIKITIVIEADD
jgi:hypothetical protein